MPDDKTLQTEPRMWLLKTLLQDMIVHELERLEYGCHHGCEPICLFVLIIQPSPW